MKLEQLLLKYAADPHRHARTLVKALSEELQRARNGRDLSTGSMEKVHNNLLETEVERKKAIAEQKRLQTELTTANAIIADLTKRLQTANKDWKPVKFLNTRSTFETIKDKQNLNLH